MRAPSPRLLPRFAWWFCEDASSRRFMFIATPPSAYSIPISYGGQMDALDALEMQRKDVPGTLSSTTQVALDTELLETVLTSSNRRFLTTTRIFDEIVRWQRNLFRMFRAKIKISSSRCSIVDRLFFPNRDT